MKNSKFPKKTLPTKTTEIFSNLTLNSQLNRLYDLRVGMTELLRRAQAKGNYVRASDLSFRIGEITLRISKLRLTLKAEKGKLNEKT